MNNYTLVVIGIVIAFYTAVFGYNFKTDKVRNSSEKIFLTLFFLFLVIITTYGFLHFFPNPEDNNLPSRNTSSIPVDTTNNTTSVVVDTDTESDKIINPAEETTTTSGNEVAPTINEPIQANPVPEENLYKPNSDNSTQPSKPAVMSSIYRDVRVTYNGCSVSGSILIVNLSFEYIGSGDVKNHLIKGYQNTITDQEGNLYDSNYMSIANVVAVDKWSGERYPLVRGEIVSGEVRFFIGNRRITKLNSLKLSSGHQFFNIPVN